MDQDDIKKPSLVGQWNKSSEEILKSHFPLHRCCRDGDVETLSLLLMKGQHGIYSEDCFYGWTPVHWAAYFGKIQCLTRLLAHGVNFDTSTVRFYQTAAHIAAFSGRSRCLKLLMHYGAVIKRKDYLGETPLHKAARTGSMECISLLVSHGADVSARNNQTFTASDLAQNYGYSECSQFLNTTIHLQQTTASQPIKVTVSNGLNGGLIPPMSPTVSNTNGCHAHHDDNDMDTVDACPVNNGHGLFAFDHHGSSVVVTNGGSGLHSNGTVGRTNGFHGNGDFAATAVSSSHSRNGLDTAPTNGFHSNQVSPGNGLMGLNGEGDGIVANGDILLADGVNCNMVAVAGRKRSREDDNEGEIKRMRTGELADFAPCYAFDQRLRAPPLLNVCGMNSSVVEHERQVTVQQGYDSMFHDVISAYHGA